MEMPTPGRPHQVLARMAGRWEGTEVMHPSPWAPEKFEATGVVVAEMKLGGFFLISDYEQKVGGHTTFQGHGVYGWEPRQERFTMHWFDTMGGDPGAPALGIFEEDRLQFVNQHPMGHGRYTYEFLGDGQYTFTLEMSADGESWTIMMEGTYTRTGS